MTSEPVTIGRDPGCDVCLADDQRVSRRHARISHEKGEWLVKDLGSTNSTFVGRERVLRLTPLSAGDQLTVGHTVLVLQGPHTTPAPELVSSDLDGLETQYGEEDVVLDGSPSNLDTEVEAEAPPLLPKQPEAAPVPALVAEPPPSSPVAAPAPVATAPTTAGGPEARLEWTGDGLGARLRLPGTDPALAGRVHAALADLQPPAEVSAMLTEVLGEPDLYLQIQTRSGAQPQLLQCTGEIILRLAAASVCAEVLLPTSR